VTEFTVPPGDPATLRSAASALGGYATEHARQLASFRAAVKTALAGWHGSAAEQYALAAGEVCGRFEGVSETLKAGQAALNRYAGALEEAQQEAARLNVAFAALLPPAGPGRAPGAADPPGSAAVREQAQTAASTLRAAQRACAQALEQARRALAVSCSGALSAPQLLALVKKIAAQLSDPAARPARQYGLSGLSLYAHAALRPAGAHPIPAQHPPGHGRPVPAQHPPSQGQPAGAREPAAAPAASAGDRLVAPAPGAVPAATVSAATRWVLGAHADRQSPGIPPGWPHYDGNMWNAPQEFAHALRSTADPVDW
jgi:uncharacterized protein YukE